GVNGVGKVDWSRLKGRTILLWPDADEAGIEAMLGRARKNGDWVKGVGELALEAGAAPGIKRVDVLGHDEDGVCMPTGWDVADAGRDGWDTDQITAWVKPRVRSFDPPKAAPPTAAAEAGALPSPTKEPMPALETPAGAAQGLVESAGE